MAAIGAAAVVLAFAGLAIGIYDLPLPRILPALLSAGGEGEVVVVRELRGPRMVGALLVGATLAAGGALLQTLTRNPLGSPDLLGISAGASTGALLTIVVGGVVGPVVGLGALAGGVGAALVVVLVSRLARSADQMGTIVLVGVSVALLLQAVNTFLVAAAPSQLALQAAVWLTGSLQSATWPQVWALAAAAAVLAPLIWLAGRQLRILMLGDDTAVALGIRLRSSQFGVLVLSALLATGAVSVAGPVPFVALVAPALARAVTRSPGPALGASVACGMLLVVVAEVVGSLMLAPLVLPVGVFTGVIGGGYLLLLLAVPAWRSRRT